jgi:predicted dehydrogenase
VNYDLWLGPVPYVPFQANRFHNGWHWWYDFGTGGMGNDGAHDIDYALWGLGVTTHPSRVAALGGKYFHDDDRQFPDTQSVVFEYPGDGKVGNKRMFFYEQRLWSTNYPYHVDSGVEFYGTKGQMFLSRRGKAQVLGERNRPVPVDLPLGPSLVADHVNDFLDAVLTGRRPNADIETAHRTSTVVHLGNIATRLGRSLRFDPQKEQIVGDEEANALVRRQYREGHWAVPKGV